MGGFQIWNIIFKDKESKRFFEKLKLHPRMLCSYCDWKEEDGDVTYFMSYQGYDYGREFLEKYIKKIKIKQFYSLDISTRGSWYNELRMFSKNKNGGK